MDRPDPLEVVDTLYASALEPDRWPAALDHLARAVGGIGAVMLFSAAGASKAMGSLSLAEANAAYEREWWRHNCRITRTQERKVAPGKTVTDYDLLTEQEIRRDPFYQDFLRPHGLGRFAGQLVPVMLGHHVSLSIERPLDQGDFERKDLELFSRLAPHAARAIVTMTRLAESQRVAANMSDAFERLDCGALFIDERRHVTLVTETARGLLGDGLSITHDRLHTALASEQRSLDRLISSALPGSPIPPLGPISISRLSGRIPLLLEVVPVRPGQDLPLDCLARGPGGVIVLVHDLSVGDPRSVVGDLERLGLTLAEARVAEAIGRGRSPKEAACILPVSESTIRTQLKSVYSKLGLSRQSELAILVTKLSNR